MARTEDTTAWLSTAQTLTMSLSLVAIIPSQGEQPQNLAITPDGKWLLCANMGGNVAVFRINAKTGELTLAGEPTPQTSPACIMIR